MKAPFRRLVPWLSIGVLSLGRATPAAAAVTGAPVEPVIELKATGPCWEDADLETRVRKKIRPSEVRTQLHVVVAGDSRQSLSLSLLRDDRLLAVRAFSAQSQECEDYLDALALAVAFSIDAVLATEVPTPPPERPAPAARARSVPRHGVRRTTRVPTGPGLLLGGNAVSGLADAVAWGPRLALTWRLSSVAEILVGVDATWPAESALGEGAALNRIVVGLTRLCYQTPQQTLMVLACAGVDAGALLARGKGFANAESGTGAWAAAGGGPALQFLPSPRIGLRASLETMWVFARPELEVVNERGARVALIRVRPLVWRLGASAVYRF